MSNFLAVGAVTALLKDLLDEGLAQQRVPERLNGAIKVGALPPDAIEDEANGETRLNLFLHRVSQNIGWRNMGLPSRNGQGERTSNPPLALDLHYLLTAYGEEDLHAEILLGCAMQLLHETPALTRPDIRRIQQAWSSGSDNVLKALATAELAEQAEQIKVSPQSMDPDEMSKLWTAFQAHYRPSVAYQATVVLIESQRLSRSPLPVLTRGLTDRGVISQADLTPPTPTLTGVTPPNKQVSAQLDDDLTLQGQRLDGGNLMDEVSNTATPSNATVRFTDLHTRRVLEATPLAGTTANQMTVRLTDATDPTAAGTTPEERWSVGIYSVAVIFRRTGETFARPTNELPFSLAPTILDPIAHNRDPSDDVTFTVRCEPEVRPEQRVALLVGDIEIPTQPHPTRTDTLTFVTRIPPGDYFVRLQVDGVNSELVNRAVEPPIFDPNQKVTVQ
jgi:hypothetical protein